MNIYIASNTIAVLKPIVISNATRRVVRKILRAKMRRMRWFRIRKANIDPELRDTFERYGTVAMQIILATGATFRHKGEVVQVDPAGLPQYAGSRLQGPLGPKERQDRTLVREASLHRLARRRSEEVN